MAPSAVTASPALSFAAVVSGNGAKQQPQMTAVASKPLLSRPAAAALLPSLEQALAQELKFHSGAQPARSDSGLITSGMRDGSAHVLRCLKVWYDLPTEVFFSALISIDRFLEKMEVGAGV